MEPPELNIDEINKLVGIKINDISQYRKAFTHKSALKKYNLKESFENLEFIGDAILSFIITRFLYEKFSDKQEGFLTKSRIKLVRGGTLATIGEKLGLYKWILMDDKAMTNGWNKNAKVLEDVFEALIGAIYIDLGLVYARKFVLGIYENKNIIDIDLLLSIDDNFKDRLIKQMKTHQITPVFQMVNRDQNGVFTVQVWINNYVYGVGQALNKKQAEQNASLVALKYLEMGVVNTQMNYAPTGQTPFGTGVCGSAVGGMAQPPQGFAYRQ